MSRISPSLYRRGVREPGISGGNATGGYIPRTPFQSAAGAVVRYHRGDGAAAAAWLDQSLSSSDYWGPNGRAQSRGWANSIRQCFEIYRNMADDDARPAIAAGLRRTIDLPPDELAIYVDVVLLDERGYVPRLVLWDTNSLTEEWVELYAAPIWDAMQTELGEGRIPEVEIWHLRTQEQHLVAAQAAAQRLAEVHRIVHRLGV